MLQEFKAFIARGNVVELAVGLIMGTAFGAITSSMVNDLVMPPIGMLLGGVNFKDLFFTLDGNHYMSLEAARSAGAPIIAWGNFINVVLNFLVISLVMFLLVKAVNKFYRVQAVAVKAPSKEVELLTEIRDLLRAQQDKAHP